MIASAGARPNGFVGEMRSARSQPVGAGSKDESGSFIRFSPREPVGHEADQPWIGIVFESGLQRWRKAEGEERPGAIVYMVRADEALAEDDSAFDAAPPEQ